MSLPYFNMYPADFEADTSHLTLEEDGAYNRLIRLMWMTPGCSLPDDDAWIARRMRCDAETFARVVKPLICEFLCVENGRVFSPRLRREAMLSEEAHKRRVDAGSKGGRKPKPLGNNGSEPSNAKAMPKQPEPEPDIRKRETKVSQESAPVSEAFDAFVASAGRRGWPEPKRLTPDRKASIRSRLSEAGGLDGWMAALRKAEESAFISSGSSWFSLDWFIGPKNFTKLMEGNYDNRVVSLSPPASALDEIALAARAR